MEKILVRPKLVALLGVAAFLLQACATIAPYPQDSSIVLGTAFGADKISSFPPQTKGANADDIRAVFPEMARMNLDVVGSAFYSSVLLEEEFSPFDSISMREVYNEGLDRVELESPIYPFGSDGIGLRSMFQQVKAALAMSFGPTPTRDSLRENFRNKLNDTWMRSLANKGRTYAATWENPTPRLSKVVLTALGASETSGHLRLTVYYSD